jgi:GTP-binding protein HflX
MKENTLQFQAMSDPLSPEPGILLHFSGKGKYADPPATVAELRQLADGCRIRLLTTIECPLTRPHPATLIGSGLVSELAALCQDSGCVVLVISREVSPAQKRNLEQAIGCKVVGRTELILDIFASRARTTAARLQVELAQLEFTLPRLAGMWGHLAGSQGGVGFRGPGETQIELDRRRIRTRIATLKRRIDRLGTSRREQRKRRRGRLQVALCGYTNAGKTTLMNLLAGCGLLANDMPFCSLESTVREIHNPSGAGFLLIDTVGFIRELPPDLMTAFRMTLEVILEADLIILAADVADETVEEKIKTVRDVLDGIGASGIPLLYCFTKTDLTGGIAPSRLLRDHSPAVGVSAISGTGIRDLLETISVQLATAAHPGASSDTRN